MFILAIILFIRDIILVIAFFLLILIVLCNLYNNFLIIVFEVFFRLNKK